MPAYGLQRSQWEGFKSWERVGSGVSEGYSEPHGGERAKLVTLVCPVLMPIHKYVLRARVCKVQGTGWLSWASVLHPAVKRLPSLLGMSRAPRPHYAKTVLLRQPS